MIAVYGVTGCDPHETNFLKGKDTDFAFVYGVSATALNRPYKAYKQRLERG